MRLFFPVLHRRSAHIARERLKILLAHERQERFQPDLLGILHEEILAVIRRHVSFEPDRVQIRMNRDKSVSTLAVDIELPNRWQGQEALAQHSWPALHGAPDASLSSLNQRMI